MKVSETMGTEALRAARRAGMPYEDEVTLEELANMQSLLMKQDKSWSAIYEAIQWAYYTDYQRGAARKVKGAVNHASEIRLFNT